MRRDGKFSKSDEEMEEDGANWMDSYSDLVTDLLAIFVVLFSFAMMSQAVANSKATAGQNSIAASVESSIFSGEEGVLDGQDSIFPEQEALMPNNDVNEAEGKDAEKYEVDGKDTADQKGGITVTEENFNSLYESIKKYIDEEGLAKHLSVEKQGDSQILLRVAASVFFDLGSADINPIADPLLERISIILNEYEEAIEMVRIEGHTDNLAINTRQYDSNWELSTSRAVNVLRYLLEISSLGPEKFSAVGYGEFHPIVSNDTEKGRARNRRVDFIIESLDE